VGQHIDQQITITWTCDGCGEQDISVRNTGQVSEDEIPKGWWTLLVVDEPVRVTFEKESMYSSLSGDQVEKAILRRRDSKAKDAQEHHFAKIFACNLCKKKLLDSFKIKAWMPKKATASKAECHCWWCGLCGAFWRRKR
jgi:transcription elongation factor Elf1